jgi:nucleoid-associated protein YgaU
MELLDQLKAKYAPVLAQMEKGAGVKLTHVHIQDQKLFIGGNVGTSQLKDELWNSIKKVDAAHQDLIADIKVDPSLATAAAAAKPAASSAEQHYTVVAGDTLSAISKKFYGDAKQYQKIFNANRDILTDPDHIKPGQSLKIPAA